MFWSPFRLETRSCNYSTWNVYPIFITTLPLEKGEVSYESFETGPDGELTTYASGFADEYAGEKNYYIDSIKDRKPYLMALVGAIALLANWLLFIVIPRKTGKDNEGV